MGNRLHLGDIDLNTTRPLTDDELENNLEFSKCADRKCSKEQEEAMGEDDSLVIPGVGRPSIPSENTAVANLVTRIVPPQVDFRRNAVTASFPVITAVAATS